MRGRVKRLTVAAGVAASALCIIGLSVGCDKERMKQEQADRQVAGILDAMARARATQVTDDSTLKSLQQAAGVAEASPAMRVHTKTLLGQAELDAANRIINRIDHNEAAIMRVAWEIRTLGSRVREGSGLVAAYGKYDPAPLQATLKRHLASAQGGSDRPLWIDDRANQVRLMSLSAVKQEISRLEGEITKQNEQIAQLTELRGKALAQAEQASQQSMGETGQQSVDDFKRSSDLRKQAADLGAQIDQHNAALLPLQRDLEVSQGQLTVLNEVIAQFQAQDKAVSEAWANVQQQMQAQGAITKAIAQGGSPTSQPAAAGGADAGDAPAAAPQSIADRAAELAALVAQVDQDRETASKYLHDASSHFSQAHAAAGEVGRSVAVMKDPAFEGAPQVEAWKRFGEAYHPLNSVLQQATAQSALAMLDARHVQSVAARLELSRWLAPVLASASLPLPKELAEGDLGKSLDDLRKQTDGEFEEADGLFVKVIEGPSAGADRVLAGRVNRIFMLCGWSQLLTGSGDVARAKEKLAMADSERSAAVDKNVALPALPQALLAGAAAAPAPATKPKILPERGGKPAAAPRAGAAGDKPADAATVAEIKQALTEVVDALDEVNIEAITGRINAAPEQAPLVDALKSLLGSVQKLKKNVTTKFGDAGKAMFAKQGAGASVTNSAEVRKALDQLQILSTGTDSVALAGPGSPQRFPMKKIGGTWKFDLAQLQKDPKVAAMLPMAAMMLKPMGDAVSGIADDVAAGKYKSVDEVQTALKELGGNMMGPGGAGPAPAGPGPVRGNRPPAPPQK